MTCRVLRRNGLVVVLISALLAVSCTSFRPVKLDDIRSHLKESDRVRVVTTDGKESTFDIVAFTDDAIFAKDHMIEFREIQSIERREPDTGKTVGVAVAAFLGLLAVPYLLIFLTFAL